MLPNIFSHSVADKQSSDKMETRHGDYSEIKASERPTRGGCIRIVRSWGTILFQTYVHNYLNVFSLKCFLICPRMHQLLRTQKFLEIKMICIPCCFRNTVFLFARHSNNAVYNVELLSSLVKYLICLKKGRISFCFPFSSSFFALGARDIVISVQRYLF